MSEKTKPKKRNRSAVSGRFVTRTDAEDHPNTTVTETVRRRKSKPADKE
jgi:hypothetical protein